MKKILLILLTMIFLFSCKDRNDDAEDSQDRASQDTSQQLLQDDQGDMTPTDSQQNGGELTDDQIGLPDETSMEVIYLEGEVNLHRQEQVRSLEIGDSIFQSDGIMTLPGSYCEIELSGHSVITIEENTIFLLETLEQREEDMRTAMYLEQGTVFCKVQKLTGDDQFQVRTPAATCGVRGTQFLVTQDPAMDDSTKLAVVEGRVLLTPPQIRWEDMNRRAEQLDSAVSQRLETLEEKLPLVQQGEEITLARGDMDRISQELNTLQQIILEDKEEIKDDVDELLREMDRAEDEIIHLLTVEIKNDIQEIRQDTVEELQELRMELREEVEEALQELDGELSDLQTEAEEIRQNLGNDLEEMHQESSEIIQEIEESKDEFMEEMDEAIEELQNGAREIGEVTEDLEDMAGSIRDRLQSELFEDE